jgi:hypothetical protein
MLGHVILFMLATAVVLMGAWAWNRLFRWKRLTDAALALFTMAAAEMTAAQLIAGAGLRAFRPLPVLAVCAALTAVPLALAWRARQRRSRAGAAAPAAREPSPPPARWRTLARAAARSPWALALAAAAGAETMLQLVSVYLLPVHAWDGLFYHLVSIAYWMQEEQIGIVPFAIWSNVYPQNAHMIFSWLVLFWRNDMLVELGQWLFGLAGAVAVAGLARAIGAGRGASIAAGCLYWLTPLVIAQATANYVDLAFASMFLVCYYFVFRYVQESENERNLWPLLCLAGVAGGLTLGMKSSAAVNIGIAALVLLGHGMYLLWQKKLTLSKLSLRAVVFATLIIAFGTFWYFRAWVVYGNPLYPFTIEAAGHTLFAGKGSVHEMIMVPNTPAEVANLPKWKQIWVSWTSEPQSATYEQRLGGYGLQWLWALVPASIVWMMYTLFRRRDLFWMLVLPFMAMFLMQPTPWWGRYTLFIVGFACVAFVGLLRVVKQSWLRFVVQLLCLALVAVSLWHQHTPESFAKLREANELPRLDRSLGKLFYSDYEFLDELPNGSKIALRFGDFAYPFFGDHFQHKVYSLQMKDEASFWRLIDEEKIDVLFTITLEPYDEWANARPDRMQPILVRERYVAYRVIHP